MDKKMNKLISSTFFFFAVIVFALFTLLLMFLDGIADFLGLGIFVFWVLLTISGIGLVFFTYKEKIVGKRRTFLLVTGFAAIGFLVFVVLHNMLYALGTLTDHLGFLDGLLNVLGASFFVLATIICPIGLIVGVVGTLVFSNKKS